MSKIVGEGPTTSQQWQIGDMSTLHLESTRDPNEAIERAAGYLAAHPVELNVIWSLLCQRVVTDVPGTYWLLEDVGEVVGVAMESPPGHAAAISPMPRDYAAVLAGAIHASGHLLSGVVGEAASASHLAGCWAERGRVPAVAEGAQRLYVLGRLALAEGVPGALRRAHHSERIWSSRGGPSSRPRPGCRPRTSLRGWTRRCRPAACSSGTTGGPDAWRGRPHRSAASLGSARSTRRPICRRRGYAAACVGALSQWVSDEAQANCILYAQLANPTSNAVYQRLGFVAVSELLAYRFGSGAR